jgi:peroxiredoxin
MVKIKTALWFRIFALVIVLGGFWWVKQNSVKAPLSTAGQVLAPAFSLKNQNQEAVSLKQFSGKVVVLHFWAAWCAPCIPEIKEWIQFVQQQKDQDIVWIAISEDESWKKPFEVIQSMGQKNSFNSNVFLLLDESAKTSESYGIYQYPETYVISPQGEVVVKWVGAREWNSTWGQQALSVLQQLKSKK